MIKKPGSRLEMEQQLALEQFTVEENFSKSGRQLYRELMAYCTNVGIAVPSYSTLMRARQRRIAQTRSTDLGKESAKRFCVTTCLGEGEAQPEPECPGSVYVIDCTELDVMVRSHSTGKVGGRPVLYSVIDSFSGMVTGFHLSLSSMRWEGATFALYNAIVPKVNFCSELGLQITNEQWPSVGVPQAIVVDKGMETSAAVVSANELGVTVNRSPKARANWKGFLERFFSQIQNTINHNLAIGSGQSNRTTSLDDLLTLRESRRLVVEAILQYNQFMSPAGGRPSALMPEDGLVRSPIGLWNWGIRNLRPSLRLMDPEVVRMHLLPRAVATVTPKGLRFFGFSYRPLTPAKYHAWYKQSGIRFVRRQVPIAFDPRELRSIILRAPGTCDGERFVLDVGSQNQALSEPAS